MDYAGLIDAIIGEDGLNYGKLPKALIKFHKYPTHSRTSLEEHLVESALYCKNTDDTVNFGKNLTVNKTYSCFIKLCIFVKNWEFIDPF